jgi:hypothetical protein
MKPYKLFLDAILLYLTVAANLGGGLARQSLPKTLWLM